ncbi:hypothetical protein B0A54_06004 [Friedmanniomyces endolithicus]|uniref:Fe2OG dioxygenase domain-containing protein n=1 Tax=Friedmanniomyces endolithicus TaxID=329885 RepID=A0A4U0V5D7_9PEZI|nr:hypothetical protein B0A54_06004 [Friedmanniomyces endolithicus]
MASSVAQPTGDTQHQTMATAAVMPQPGLPKAAFKPIIQGQATKRKLEHVDFDPRQHLAFEEPQSIVMMRDIGYSEDTDWSYRKHTTHNGLEQRLKHLLTLPPLRSQNISVKSEKQALDEKTAVELQRKSFADDEGIAGCPWEDDKPVVGWHRDSYPFVCVTMLSDCTNMVGGESALKMANGEVMRPLTISPQGCAVVMQGRYITHQALRALGAQERITMVTSFRPRSPFLPDDSVLSTVRGISRLPDLYYEFGRYRLEMLERRIQTQIKRLREDHDSGKKTDTKALKAFLDEQEQFVRRTNSEMIPEEEVIEGHQPEMGLENVKLPTPPEDEERPVKRTKVA